jgi:hypothetical protein
MLGEPLRVDEVDLAPNGPGLYAWYHHIELNDTDIEECELRLSSEGNGSTRHDVLDTFLREHVFHPYKETNYTVEVSGKLKPRYAGSVAHVPRLGDDFLELLSAVPGRLGKLKRVMRAAVPLFASPVYVGVATKSLRTRLRRHQNLLLEYRELGRRDAAELLDEDHSFAFEAICVRGFVPTDLMVFAMELDDAADIARAAEYILNRINYPLCGRN